MNRGRPKKTGPKTPPTIGHDDRVVIAHIKGSPDYAAWLDNIHTQTHIPKAVIFRLGVSVWAQQNGYTKPPDL